MAEEINLSASKALANADVSANALGNAAREMSELQSMLVIAKRFPRDEKAAIEKLMATCQRVTFADDALYSFQRGGKPIEGPSVYFAREAARIWGNITYGARVVDTNDETVHIRCYAVDLETNTKSERDAAFKASVQRKNHAKGTTEWVKPDERDLRELVNKHGSIATRNALLDLLPSDIVNEAIRQCKATSAQLADGVKNDPARFEKLLTAFLAIGVNEKMLSDWGGVKDPRLISAEQVATLRTIYKTVTDGAAKVSDFFGDSPKPAPVKVDPNELSGISGKVDPSIKDRHKKAEKVNTEPGEDEASAPAEEEPAESDEARLARLQAARKKKKGDRQGSLIS